MLNSKEKLLQNESEISTDPEKSSYFEYRNFKENAEVGITACESRLPTLKNVLDQVSAYHIQKKFPALNIFFAPATYVWILVAFFVSFIALLRGSDLFPLFPAALLFATVLLGPCVLVRYMFPFMTLAPYCLAAYSARRH